MVVSPIWHVNVAYCIFFPVYLARLLNKLVKVLGKAEDYHLPARRVIVLPHYILLTQWHLNMLLDSI